MGQDPPWDGNWKKDVYAKDGSSYGLGRLDETLKVELFYPRNSGPTHVEVGLVDVRAADDIRIHYDHERDGWVIEQASIFEWDVGDEVCDQGWTEVAFIKAWALADSKDG